MSNAIIYKLKHQPKAFKILDIESMSVRLEQDLDAMTTSERVLWLQRNIPVLKAVSGLTLDVRE